MDRKERLERVLQAGATKAAYIGREAFVLSPSFRDICREGGCGKYGRCWMCPPDIGTIEDNMAQALGFREGLLYQTIGEIEDSFDLEGMEEAGKNHARVTQRIRQEVLPGFPAGSLLLSCGGCGLCPRCARLEDLPCRHPEEAVPSLEGYGFDVYRTSQGTELHYINGANTVTFFGMVLFSEEE